MKEELRPGTWCEPSSPREWNAIIELAKSLDLYAGGVGHGYDICRYVWCVGNASPSAGRVCECAGRGTGFDPNRYERPISVPDFIAGMYAMKGRVGDAPKPPLGLIPKWAQMEGRLRDITSAMDRYREARMEIPQEWKAERDEIVDYLWRRKQGIDKKQESVIMQPLVDLAKKVLELGGESPNQLVGVKQLMIDGPEMRKAMDDILNHKTNKQRFAAHEDRLHSLEVKSVLFDDILKRLTTLEQKKPLLLDVFARLSGLEKAPDEHLQEYRYHQHQPHGGIVTAPPEPLQQERKAFMCGVEYLEDGVNHLLYIDPKASPKGIPFEVALAYLKAGRRIRKPSFRAQWYWELRDGKIKDAASRSVCDGDIPFNTDLIGSDWEVIPEQ